MKHNILVSFILVLVSYNSFAANSNGVFPDGVGITWKELTEGMKKDPEFLSKLHHKAVAARDKADKNKESKTREVVSLEDMPSASPSGLCKGVACLVRKERKAFTNSANTLRMLENLINISALENPSLSEAMFNFFISPKAGDTCAIIAGQIGTGYALNGKLKDSVRLLSWSIKIKKSQAVLLNLGSVYATLNRNQEAIDCLETARTLYADSFPDQSRDTLQLCYASLAEKKKSNDSVEKTKNQGLFDPAPLE